MSNSKMESRPIQLFYSYSHLDELLRDELEKHLSMLKKAGVIVNWHDRNISGGSEWEKQIDQHLADSQIILLLVSADFLSSDYCYDLEMSTAMRMHQSGEARVIPIILRPVDWSDAPFAHIQALPKDAKPVTTWPNQDEAWLDIAKSIRITCQEIQQIQPLGNVSSSGSGIQIRCVKTHLRMVVDGSDLPRPNCIVETDDFKKVYPLSWVRSTVIPLEARMHYRITAYCDVPLGSGAYVTIECSVDKNHVIPYIYEPSNELTGRPSQLIWGP